MNRIVAIVGRPNVGKSALFNRLAGRRIAIVHEESGVTRDRLAREVEWDSQRFELVDTGGITGARSHANLDEIERGIRVQAEAALQDAAVLILVVDSQKGVTAMDQEVAALLRERGLPVLVAANKCDESTSDSAADDFAELSFPVFPVSALHNRGVPELMQAVVRHLPAPVASAKVEPLRVAVVGRPNVGKSSFINRLLRSERVIVSAVPGTTRDSIDVPFSIGRGPQARHYVLIDTAGIRRLGKIDTSVERFGLIRAENSIDSCDVAVLMMDAVQGPTAQDKKIAAKIVESRKSCVILVNKWDLAEGVTQREYGPALAKAIPFMGYCPVVFGSAKSGFNIKRAIEAVDHVAGAMRATLPTGLLNRTILNACERTPAPSRRHRRLKVLYSTQVGTAPIRVRLFVNEPTLVPPEYRNFLVNTLRAQFGLEGVPIVLSFTSRRDSDVKR